MTARIVGDFEMIDVNNNGREASPGINSLTPQLCELQLVRMSIGKPSQIVDVRDFLQLDIQKRQLSSLYLAAQPHKVSQAFFAPDAVIVDHCHRDGTDR